MSDYVHKKVVRLPMPENLVLEDEDDYFDIFDTMLREKSCPEKTKDRNGFELCYSDDNIYIDWVYYDTYGEESGDYGNVRLLTERELAVIKPYFNKLGVEYEDNDLRLVDYCYYNCCGCPDYYDLADEDQDDADLFLN